jgi:tRNA (guanine-N7-)-methyltransferase
MIVDHGMRRFDPSRVPIPKQFLDFQGPRVFPHVDLEIGSGVGRFAIDRAQKFNGRALIAIEKTIERFGKFKNRVAHHVSMPNLFPVHAEAASFITHCIPPDSLDAIYILYPNPYPKAKHHNLRWHNRAFTGFLLERLHSGGTLTLATNIEDYREEAAARFADTWHLQTMEDKPISPQTQPRTHFERKYLLRGETCWQLVFKKP